MDRLFSKINFRYFNILFALISLASFFCNPASAQDIENIVLDHNEANQNFGDFASNIESKFNIKFQFLPEWFKELKVKRNYVNTTLKDALHDILFDTEISFMINYNYYVVFYKNPSIDMERKKILDNINRNDQINQIIIGSAKAFELGKEITFSGQIKDVINSEPLIGASIYIKELERGVITDINGSYSIKLPAGLYNMSFSFINYETENKIFNIISDGKFNLEMFESTLTLDDVVISSEAEDSNVSSSQVGKESLSIEAIKSLPSFLGEVDIIKSIQLLPGVTSIGEGATGFNVRGGSIDQNLVTLDGVQVFNYSHLLGFFSAFNPSTVKGVTLYRGGIPAEYGQRLSSILDVKMKDGNNEKFAAEGGIGLVSSNLMIEGPLKKNKSSFIIAGRSTYSDWLLNQVKNQSIRKSSASFYDFNARITHKINDKNKLYVSSYLSHDQFTLASDTLYNWNTKLVSLKLNHLFNPKLVGNFSLSAGSYGYSVNEPEPDLAFDLSFNVKYEQFAASFEYFKEKHKIGFGFQSNLYHFQPGEINPTDVSSNINSLKLDQEKGLENGVFISDEFEPFSKVKIIAGLRFTTFSSLGGNNVFNYAPDQPRNIDSVIDTLNFDNSEFSKTYSGLEPRFSMRYLLSNNSSIKLGYNRIYQYIHLISNTTAATPIDIWQSSNTNIEPQYGDQISLGYFKNLRDNTYEFSLEGYYKIISNLLDYKNGAELILNEHLETDLLQGEGRSFGIEFLIKKSKGRFTGWGSYTFSRAESKIKGSFREETINNGEYFPSNFNKPHDMTLVGDYKISKRFTLNFNFTYSTGRPVTVPVSKYQVGDVVINNFSNRNQYKIPDYHRLDLGVTIKTNHRKNKLWEGNWTISIYNLYGRKNAYSVFFEDSNVTRPAAKKLSVLGSPFPAISYNFKI